MSHDKQQQNISEKSQIVFIGGDHAGYELKEILKKYLIEKKYRVEDVGTYTTDRCDYPDFATKLCEGVIKHQDQNSIGVLVCGSGIGISMAANKYPGIRCALCQDRPTAIFARENAYCNVIALGGRVTGSEVAKDCIDAFISSEIKHDSAYKHMLEKLAKVEEANLKSY